MTDAERLRDNLATAIAGGHVAPDGEWARAFRSAAHLIEQWQFNRAQCPYGCIEPSGHAGPHLFRAPIGTGD